MQLHLECDFISVYAHSVTIKANVYSGDCIACKALNIYYFSGPLWKILAATELEVSLLFLSSSFERCLFSYI